MSATVIAALLNVFLSLPEVAGKVIALFTQYQQQGTAAGTVTPAQVQADLAKLDADLSSYDQA